MREENNTWRNKFSPSDLENEDWLEPSDGLFAAIEDEIYGEEKEKKIAFLFPLLGLGVLILLVTLGVIFFGNGNSEEPTQSLSENSISNASSPNKLDNTQEITKTTSSSLVDEYEEIKEETVKTTNDQSISVSESKSAITQSKSFLEQNPTIEYHKKSNSLNSGTKGSVFSTSTIIEARETTTINSDLNLVRPSIDNEIMKSSLMENLSFLDRQKYFISWIEDKKIEYDRKLSIKTQVEPLGFSPNKRNLFYFGLGAHSTRYNLNEVFASAVDPADFTHNTGKGIAINAGYEYKINRRFSVFVEATYHNTALSSGHNANYDYPRAGEVDGSNRVVLTMATPLGFMEGSVLVNRESDTEELVPMVLDLHNEHSYHTVSISTGINYMLLEFNQFSISGSAGMGVDKIFGLSNNLTEVISSDSNFGTSERLITADQSSIRKTIPRMTVGLGLSKQFSSDRSIRLNYDWTKGLRAIHSFSDTNTGMSRHGISIELLQMF